jgi:hypothetical protein
MARPLSEIDRFVEHGLARYSQGDLDAAIAAWEAVLEIDPHHERALGYLDYVRLNYELLMSEVSGHGEAPPFAIADEEVRHRGEVTDHDSPILRPATAVPRPHTNSDGWGLDAEAAPREPLPAPPERAEAARGDDGDRASEESIELVLEADEPAELDLDDRSTLAHPFPASGAESSGISFDDATSEYQSRQHRRRAISPDFRGEVTPTPGFGAELTPGFGTVEDAQTPPGFAALPTDVRRRDLGFVQPVMPGPGAGASAPDREHRRAGSSASELHLTLRTPAAPRLPGVAAAPDASLPAIGAAPTVDMTYDHDAPTRERPPRARSDSVAELLGARATMRHAELDPRAPPAAADAPPHSLAPRARTASVAAGTAPALRDAAPDRGAPAAARPAAGAGRSGPAIELGSRLDPHDFDAPTQRKQITRPSLSPPAPEPPPAAAAIPREPRGGTAPGARQPALTPLSLPLPASGSSLVTAPTRDLGLRPGGGLPPGFPRDPGRQPADPGARGVVPALDPEATDADASDEPTRHRPPTSTGPRSSATHMPEPTRQDLVLPFDPIDARSAQILSAVDAGAPASEAADDRLRRRITALFDHASASARAGDLERAVAAIDLALSEDPNAALAQRLIHRNRDAIMTVLGAYLADLSRVPVLARPLHELAAAPISPRAAFLLSRIDGVLSIDEILDVSGMPRIEAYRYLCQLYLRGILR